MREFTVQELAQCNGKDGAPAYIAHEGELYDVSNSFLWQGGRHQVLHRAKDRGHRLTPQRVAVLRQLAASEGHPSVEQISDQIVADFPIPAGLLRPLPQVPGGYP